MAQKEKSKSIHATGNYEVASWDEKTWDGKDHKEVHGAKLTHAKIVHPFHGGFEGEGKVQYVMSYLDDANATFVGLMQMNGRLGDRSGTFVMKIVGAFANGEARSTWSVIPDSGTGDLKGLRGEGETVAVHADLQPYTFDYSFE